MSLPVFDPECHRCKRLSGFLHKVKREHPDYYCQPVPSFGAKQPKLLIVGLAPGLHGANRTGRPFTGDYAGILLYETLHKFGFSNRSESVAADDGLRLKQCRITNAVKCLPPANKPTGAEITTCNTYLAAELAGLKQGAVVLALGSIAHNAVLKALGLKLKDYPFGHGVFYSLPSGLVLATSYHCSRYNTQTRRLTEAMFHAVFRRIRRHLGG
ncbi:MAG: uracil-DNA glycosylase [Thiohalomonadales bacterium]|nr:uracil-DNA glycosylase [Thiohalomonadales bacterium]